MVIRINIRVAFANKIRSDIPNCAKPRGRPGGCQEIRGARLRDVHRYRGQQSLRQDPQALEHCPVPTGISQSNHPPGTRLSLGRLLKPTIIACFLTSRVPRFPIFDDKAPHPHPRAG